MLGVAHRLAWVVPLLLGGARLAAADAPYQTNLTAYQAGLLGTQPNQTFHSSPVVAPILQINSFQPDKIDPDSAPYIFTAGSWGSVWGSTIFSSKDLSLVYEDYDWNELAQATQAWMFHGRRVYAALEGSAMRIFNESYHELYTIVPQGDLKGVGIDTHEAVITQDNTVMIIVCPAKTVDLSSQGGSKDQVVFNCMFQEIDPKTNKVLFQWAVLDYFNPYDSFIAPPSDGDWDFSHQNSVEKTLDGDYIASYRHLCAVIKVSGSTGKVKWVMGGKRNTFKGFSDADGDTFFAYQHDARVVTNNSFTVFDNAQLDNGFCGGKNCSRGLEVEYYENNMTVKTVNQWPHPQQIISASCGGVQRMANGHTFVAWGQNPGWTEYSADGECILDFARGQMGIGDESEYGQLVAYRGWKDDWMPTPPWGPNISAVDGHVYVSWNGLLVSDWVLLMSNSKSDLDDFSQAVARSPRNGFETMFDLSGHGSATFARVIGLDSNDTVLGSTPVVNVSSGELFTVQSKPKVDSAAKIAQSVSTSAGVSVPTGDASTTQINATTPDSSTDGLRTLMGTASTFALCMVGFVVLVL